MNESLEDINFLSHSENRIDLLKTVRQRGPIPRDVVRDHVDASRTTVKRNLDAFQDRGWIKKSTDGYQITRAGELIAIDFMQLMETVELTQRLDTFFAWMPDSFLDFDLTNLSDARITRPTAADPYAPATRQTELTKAAGNFRGLFPIFNLDGVREFHSTLMSGKLSAEVIVTTDVAELIEGAPQAGLLAEEMESGQLDIFVTAEEIPCFVGIAEHGPIQIGINDDEGIPRALVETDAEEVRRWAERTFEEYLAEAERFRPS